MDPFSQGLLGAVGAQLVFGRSLGHRAWIAGLGGGLLPDADILLERFADPALPWSLHRHFTHALVMVPALGALATGIFCAFSRTMRAAPRAVFGAATLGVLTHAPLDYMTSYGTKIFWPFSSHGYTSDLYPIVDPLLTLVMLVGVIFAARKRSIAPVLAVVGFLAVYTGLCVHQKGVVEDAQARIAASRGHTIDRMRVMPMPGGPWAWRSLYMHDGVMYADAIRTTPWGDTEWIEGDAAAYVPLEEALVDVPVANRGRVADVYRRFARFADGYVGRSPDDPRVLADHRLAMGVGMQPLWGIRLAERADEVPVTWQMNRGASAERIGDLWALLTGTTARLQPLPESP